MRAPLFFALTFATAAFGCTPRGPVKWGQPGPELTLGIARRGEVVEAIIENHGKGARRVSPRGVTLFIMNGRTVVAEFADLKALSSGGDDADETLSPGEWSSMPIDVGQSARRRTMLGRKLPPGQYAVTAKYWPGADRGDAGPAEVLEAGPIFVEVR